MTMPRLPVPMPRLDKVIKRREDLQQLGPINADVLMFVMLDEIAGRLEELTEIEITIGRLIEKMEGQMQRVPTGIMRPFSETITATQNSPKKWEVIDHIDQESCSYAIIDNRSDNSLWVCLNDIRNGFKQVRKNQDMKFDYLGHGRIFRFFLYTISGGSTDIEITLEY